MSKIHPVAVGEYMELIAMNEGFTDYKLIYNDPHNASFKTARPNPDILFPGDQVYIPDLDPGHADAPTDKKHTFVAKKKPNVTLDLHLQRNREPLKNNRYTLTFKDLAGKDHKLTGTTGADGHLVQKEIPVGVAEVKLTVASLPSYTRTLKLGFLHPITVPSGVQMGLNNLGFACGPANGAQSPAYTAALRAFQQKHLPQNVTGKLDKDTLDALRNEYDKGIKS